MNIKKVLARSEQYLARYNVEQPRLDAEVLLADLLEMERIKLYVNYDYPLSQKELGRYRERITRRARRIPVAHITGSKEFMSLELEVNPEVLLPRPETELLVEEVLDYCNGGGPPKPNIVDVGTGSGAIMVSLGYYLEKARILGIDIAPAAVSTARRNIARYDLGERLKVVKGDLLQPLITRNKDNVDIVAANPPYIREENLDKLQPEVRREPRQALDGGPEGLQVYRKLIPQAKQVLKEGGLLVMEFGEKQAPALKQLLSGWQRITIKKDHAGKDRIICAHRGARE